MTKSSYRKTYIPHTELKTRTSLQYHYSWNTCENDLAVPVEPAKTKNPITKAKTKLPAKSLCLVIVSQYESGVDQLTDPNSFSTCMMNASTFLQWFITYELTRNQWSQWFFFYCSTSTSMYSKELRTTCHNLQRYTEHMIIPKPLPNSGKFLAWQRAAIERLTFPIQN